MKIVACVKATPDTTATVKVTGGKVTWGDAPLVINPWDEFAVEAALRLKEAGGGTVTALSVGGEDSKVALRHALAMGADDALLVSDPALVSPEPQAVARVLAAAVKKIGAVDLVLIGRQAIDDDFGTTPAQVARLLGWPALTLVSVIKVEGADLHVERATEEGRQCVSAKLPAVLSPVKDYGEARVPLLYGHPPGFEGRDPGLDIIRLGYPRPGCHPPATRVGRRTGS